MTELRPGERMALHLRDLLAERVGDRALLTLEGGKWKRELRIEDGDRSCVVSCRTNPAAGKTVVMGMGNAYLRGAWVESPPAERFPTHFQVQLYGPEEELRPVGHTGDLDEAGQLALDWVVRKQTLAEIYRAHEYVDRLHRRLFSLGKRLALELRRRESPLPGSRLFHSGELWYEHGERSVRFEEPEPGLVSATLVLWRTPLVTVPGVELERVVELMEAWCAGSHPDELGDDVIVAPGAAAFLEGDTAAWLWGTLRELAPHHAVLRAFGPFLDAVWHSPLARSFYAFTQVRWLRFSLCSHYPFDTTGMPTVYSKDPSPSSGYLVKTAAGEKIEAESAQDAVAIVEDCLRKVSRSPWYGDEDTGLEDRISAALAGKGSSWQGERRYSSARSSVVVVDGERVLARAWRRNGRVNLTLAEDVDVPRRLNGELDEVVRELLSLHGG